MTITKEFEKRGFTVEEIDFCAFDSSPCRWKVTNAKGHKFIVSCANSGQFTIDSEEKRLCTHCLFRTAVKLIKNN